MIEYGFKILGIQYYQHETNEIKPSSGGRDMYPLGSGRYVKRALYSWLSKGHFPKWTPSVMKFETGGRVHI